ncbi:MAG: NAD-glutamate dehydrogenase domain-containing protein [Oligoflexales bacterium]
MVSVNQNKDSFERELGEEDELPSYEKDISPEQLETYIDDIADTVRVGLDQSISILTPWFFNNMPKIYYQTTPRQEKVRHLSAIITGHVFETKQTVELWDRDKSKVTYIGPGGDRKILVDMAKKLSSQQIKMGGLYFSRDNLLFLSTFFCSEAKDLDFVNKRIMEKVQVAKKMMLTEFPDAAESIERYVKNLDNDLVMYATASRLSITYRMVHYMLTHEGAHTFLDCFENSPTARLTIGLKNVNAAEILEPVLHLFHRYDFNIGRAFIVNLSKGYSESICVMHFIVNHASGEKVTKDFIPAMKLVKALRTLGWVDNDEYSLFAREPYNYSINSANFIRSLGTWCHLFLSKHNPYAYTNYRIRSTFFKYADLTEKVVNLFRIKFDPLKEKERKTNQFEATAAEMEQQIEHIIEEVDRNIFRECINFVTHCLKTNYFHGTKTGHAFRLSPDVLDSKFYKDKPFGIFFVTGKDYRMFHVRWKDISRGGMRVVMPRNNGDYDYALAGLFDEVYGLSFAQQLKNKDIPEGGSKAVVVIKPGGHRDQVVKGAVNALLDLLVEEDESHEKGLTHTISYYDKSEIIYLGPDENITNELITWIPEQAERRGYKYARAFMSSKPGDGINHKEYGVTSEGLNVYVDNMLHAIGISPTKEKFTIKITGGPDGDVAGNELKILHREYGENARVVLIADGYGCAYDPNGLAWDELLRLVRESSSVSCFSKAKLSSSAEAFVITADTIENIKLRNESYMRLYADIFIPGGGRPYSVNEKNWKLFLNKDGKPTLRAIVEGANIFFTAEARKHLQETGVLIIKDSSANKTGVICSSFEIIASLIMTQQEFRTIKEQYVKEVIEILRAKADAEAKLLFRSYVQYDGQKTLVELSLDISKEINTITDIMLDELTQKKDEVIADPFYQEIVVRHCPPLLRDQYRSRILEKLPDPHKIAIIASSIASFVVYNEGLNWLKGIPKEHWYWTLRVYMEKDRLSSQLLDVVAKSNIGEGERQQISAILARSAAKDLTIIDLQKRLVVD